MSRVAALYDIHGNLPALEAVLDDVAGAKVDRIVIGGDVLPGPMPRECLEELLRLDLPVDFIKGNGDRASLALSSGATQTEVPEAFRDAVRWSGSQLTPVQAKLVGSWPATITLPVRGLGDVLFCHATARNDVDVFTRNSPDARVASLFDGVHAPVAICGHTHMQFDRTVGGLRIVNAGSVGMPFAAPGAYWLLLGPDVAFRRTSYDLAEAARRVQRTRYPQSEWFAGDAVLHPASEESMLQRYAALDAT